jgi:hypothetical protein
VIAPSPTPQPGCHGQAFLCPSVYVLCQFTVPELIQLIRIDPFSRTVVIVARQGFQLLIQLIHDLR